MYVCVRTICSSNLVLAFCFCCGQGLYAGLALMGAWETSVVAALKFLEYFFYHSLSRCLVVSPNVLIATELASILDIVKAHHTWTISTSLAKPMDELRRRRSYQALPQLFR
ncbi:hypothetical protein BJX64DRAFT_262538 [Aspergillus heterothallicus]